MMSTLSFFNISRTSQEIVDTPLYQNNEDNINNWISNLDSYRDQDLEYLYFKFSKLNFESYSKKLKFQDILDEMKSNLIII